MVRSTALSSRSTSPELLQGLVTTCPTDECPPWRVVGSQANSFSGAMLSAQNISLIQQTSSVLAKYQDLQNLHLTDSTATNVTEMSDIASEDVGCAPPCLRLQLRTAGAERPRRKAFADRVPAAPGGLRASVQFPRSGGGRLSIIAPRSSDVWGSQAYGNTIAKTREGRVGCRRLSWGGSGRRLGRGDESGRGTAPAHASMSSMLGRRVKLGFKKEGNRNSVVSWRLAAEGTITHAGVICNVDETCDPSSTHPLWRKTCVVSFA